METGEEKVTDMVQFLKYEGDSKINFRLDG